jgi:ABC-type polysaccharide/polyol phosphate export permease
MNIKLRFKGTYLGLLWSVLEPLFMFTILFVVFSTIRSSQKEDFAIYLIVGVFFYHLFSRGTTGGLTSLVGNGGILKSLKINREIFPVIATGTTVIFVLVELIVLFGLMPVFDFIPTSTIVFFPIILGLFIVLILGISYLLSILFIFVRDIQPIWTVITYALLFVSPIFWFVSEVDGILLDFQKFNVLGQIIELAHKVVVFGQIPSLNEWLYTTSIIIAIFFVGFGLFKKFENKVAERV